MSFARIFDIIAEIVHQGVTVLIVEQNAELALSLVDRAYVLESGTVTLEGSAEQLRNTPSIRDSYLGQ